jgi:NADPH:quinone reductase
MKAIVCNAFGPLEDVVYCDVPDPVPKPNQVLVAVRVSSVGFMDTLMIEGRYQLKPPLPYIPGACGAGEVIAVGSDVTTVKVGDRVSFLNYYGAFAELIATDEHTVVVLPTEMDYEQAATYRLSYSPAYLALKYRANLQAGETFLITGASGGVGLAAIRLAKNFGARVIAVIGREEKRGIVAEVGADEVINYNDCDLRDTVMEMTGGHGTDVILDVVGGDVFDQAIRCVARLGRVVVMGFTSGRIPEVKVNRLLLKNSSIHGVWLGDWMTHDTEGFRKMNGELLELAAEGKIPALISERFDLENIVAAMRLLLSRVVVGKIVVRTNL